MDDEKLKVRNIIKVLSLIVSVIVIALVHNYTTSNGRFLLHEISQRLFYLPIVYAAYNFGTRGGLVIALLSGVAYYVHIGQHAGGTQATILNQYVEIIMFLVVGIFTGFLANAERSQRQRFEKAAVALDATSRELKNAVDFLIEANRLMSVGKMAAGMAHEIRNPLSAIKGAIEILEKEIPSGSSRRKFVKVIEDETDRLLRMTGEFLSFAKPRPPSKASVDLNQLIKSVLEFVANQAAKANVRLTPQFDRGLPSVYADAEQIKQVLLNLILNAIRAMPEGGKIEVGSRRQAETVEMFVRDYGVGIEPDIADEIFDTFFTTQPDGSGLGLSVAYQIVKQHDGEIELVKTNEPGSLFVVRLPLVAREKHEEAKVNSRHRR